MRTHDYWGKIDERDGVITLNCDEAKAKAEGGDGIGSALTFVEWDGKPLALTVERTRVWRSEPWADLWFVATEHGEPAAWMRKPWPMRYARFTQVVAEVGMSLGMQPEDQRIIATIAYYEADVDPAKSLRQGTYGVSWEQEALHIDWQGHVVSIPSPVCELGLYGEGCVCEVGVE